MIQTEIKRIYVTIALELEFDQKLATSYDREHIKTEKVRPMQGKKFLVVDDDIIMRQLVEYILCRSGGEIVTANDGLEGLKMFETHQPDMVILDISMPNMTGWEVCQHIRQSSDVPIIMLTSLGHEKDVIRGFNEGADDYITKPFNGNILRARIQALLRRAEIPKDTQKLNIYSDDYLTIDLSQRRVLVDGKPVKLTGTEHRLLAYLIQNAGKILPFHKILENVWSYEYREKTDYVHVYMWHLRKKLERNPKSPKYLITEHGIGYRFEKAKLQLKKSLQNDKLAFTPAH